MTRLLVVMGSGETTPGALGVHREVFAALPDPPVALLLDSPFAFQENADELVERIGQYFAESVGRRVSPVRLPAGADALALERALADIRGADWVFAGPGSPSYARRCWAGTPIPDALADVVAPGRSGVLMLASAAAVTLGDWALPVYEIYKVGEEPRWEPGLGIMGRVLGWRCAVVPHYDNREGGTHDTRFCYVGARRLSRIEPDLGDGFILGVDEHTSLLLDLEAQAATVAGRGEVTLRVQGAEDTLPAGARLPIAELEDRVAALGAGAALLVDRVRGSGAVRATTGAVADPTDARVAAPSQASPADLAHAILAALPASATRARAAVVALASRAEEAALEHSRDLAGQVVGTLVAERAERRASGDWAASDRLRDVLAGVGVEVRDTREGSTWTWR